MIKVFFWEGRGGGWGGVSSEGCLKWGGGGWRSLKDLSKTSKPYLTWAFHNDPALYKLFRYVI